MVLQENKIQGQVVTQRKVVNCIGGGSQSLLGVERSKWSYFSWNYVEIYLMAQRHFHRCLYYIFSFLIHHLKLIFSAFFQDNFSSFALRKWKQGEENVYIHLSSNWSKHLNLYFYLFFFCYKVYIGFLSKAKDPLVIFISFLLCFTSKPSLLSTCFTTVFSFYWVIFINM